MDVRPVDWNSAVPPWQQIETDLRQRIETGQLTGLLPGLRPLARAYGVSPGVVAKAAGALKKAGLLRASQGWGTQVVPPGERGS